MKQAPAPWQQFPELGIYCKVYPSGRIGVVYEVWTERRSWYKWFMGNESDTLDTLSEAKQACNRKDEELSK